MAFFSVASVLSENRLHFVSKSTFKNFGKIANALQKLLNKQMQMFSSQKPIKVRENVILTSLRINILPLL